MKQWISLVFAGVLGGVVTLTGSYLLQSNDQAPVSYTPTNVQTRPVVSSAWSSNAPLDFVQAAQKATPSVVNITAKITTPSRSREDFFFFSPFGGRDNGPAEGTGSGVIYSENGYIITNNHVVEGANELEVTLSDNRKFKAKLIGTYKKADLAVIKIEATGLLPAEIGNSDEVRIGEWALAVGNPFELNSTVTAGIISAKGRNIDLLGKGSAIEAFIQTDAAVNPGNSGGALVDAQGRLIGINTAIATRTGSFQGYSFAIPINLARRVVDDLINFGDYKRPYLGVTIFDLDSESAKELGVEASQGVVVDGLEEGGSAQYAGIQERDVIVGVDGREVKSVPELQEVISRAKVGDTVNLKVLRKNKAITVAVKLRELKNQ